jgi:opacity protein-like surface antigen
MKTLIAVVVSALLLAVPAVAQQEYPKAEVFGGYQFTHLDPSINANGWNAAVNGNVNPWLGVTADFSGAYKNGGRVHTYMFGPTFSARTERITPFAHALFGGATGGGSSAFSMALGGGLDVNAGRHLALRLVQADWLLFRSGGVTDRKNVRVSAGLVLRF